MVRFKENVDFVIFLGTSLLKGLPERLRNELKKNNDINDKSEVFILSRRIEIFIRIGR